MPRYTEIAIRRHQSGLAMLALVTLLALVSSYFIASALTRTTSDVQIARDGKTLQTLNEAKAALISWVAQDTFNKAYNSTTTNFQPGSLPCPDTNDDGYAEGSCATADTRIGRFPWRTVNAPDLRDGSGERLWYAISGNYRAASGTTVINPDTAGTLSVSGSFTASNIPAIIFSPGTLLSGQTRNPQDSTGWNSVSNFLDGANAGSNDDAFYAGTATTTFNDQLVLVSSDDIFKVAEGAAHAMMQQLVGIPASSGSLYSGGYFETYRSTWGRYPFPAQFTNPSTSTYQGTVGQTSGLLPITTDTTFVTWRTSPTPTLVDTNLTTGDISTQTCTASTSTQISCDLTWSSRPTIQVALNLNGAGQAFVGNVSLTQVSLTYISNGFTLTPTAFTATHSLSPYQSGNAWGTVTLQFRLPTRTTTYGTVRLKISLPSFLAITTTTDPNTGWILTNQWHRYIQYAVASGYLPNSASGSCTAGGTCLTASGLPSSFTATNDKRVLLVFAGRALAADASSSPAFAAQTHHSSSLSSYFEGANAISGDTLFTHQQAASRSFNDKIVVVAP